MPDPIRERLQGEIEWLGEEAARIEKRNNRNPASLTVGIKYREAARRLSSLLADTTPACCPSQERCDDCGWTGKRSELLPGERCPKCKSDWTCPTAPPQEQAEEVEGPISEEVKKAWVPSPSERIGPPGNARPCTCGTTGGRDTCPIHGLYARPQEQSIEGERSTADTLRFIADKLHDASDPDRAIPTAEQMLRKVADDLDVAPAPPEGEEGVTLWRAIYGETPSPDVPGPWHVLDPADEAHRAYKAELEAEPEFYELRTLYPAPVREGLEERIEKLGEKVSRHISISPNWGLEPAYRWSVRTGLGLNEYVSYGPTLEAALAAAEEALND